ncbi:hypothetical protein C0992_007386 [Termitomyces sp. T32_za158]|nr:hypothetical protein C0992_007386 [Termitomyces sp. T32_za158]
MVQHIGPDSTCQDPQLIEFLWVRCEDDAAFGFLDPKHIIRGVHLIPSFTHGQTQDLLPPSEIARSSTEKDKDYQLFNVGMFVDRDMIMRFYGGGVGHNNVREATNIFLDDRHTTDKHPNDGVEHNDSESDTEDISGDTAQNVQQEEDDYGYANPMNQQELDEEPDGLDESEREDNLELDFLGPEDGDECIETLDELLGYTDE